MRKALIITYYWPPSGGAGVQRWLKFAKYMRNFGWEPVIYTPENPEMPVTDTSLLKDVPENITVLKTPVWEPYSWYKRFVGQKQHEKINTGFLAESRKPKFTETISVWIRGNIFIPDARMLWITPSTRFLENHISENKVDAIISTGPPHSMHLIALGLKKKTGIPWIADFRDPWTNIDFYGDLMLTRWADRKHRRLESEVLTTADSVLTIGPTMKSEFEQLLDDRELLKPGKVVVISNGYDEEDLAVETIQHDKKFSLVHIGTLVRSRNPKTLWMALSELVKKNGAFADDLKLCLVGKVDMSVLDSIEQYGLMRFVGKTDYLPHDEAVKVQQNAQVLLWISNQTKNAKGILTGKFFEYLAARRPILAIGATDGDAAQLINETNSAKISDFNDGETLKKNILSYYEEFRADNLVCKSKNIEKYSRKELTKSLCELLNEMTATKR